MGRPEISVIIPNRNYSEFIGQCIESAINQTYKGDYEIIVCDDNSTDDSIKVIRKYPQVRLLIKRDGKPSVPATLNCLLKKAQGKYITQLQSDDFWDPNFLEVMIKTIREKNVKGVYCDQRAVNKFGKPTGEFTNYPSANSREQLHGLSLYSPCGVVGSCYLIAKKVFDDVGGYNEKCVYGEDREWSMKATKYYYLYHIKEILKNKRVHPRQMGRMAQGVGGQWSDLHLSEFKKWLKEREKDEASN